MKKILKSVCCLALSSVLAISTVGCASSGSKNGSKDITLKALFMKQAGYSEEDINAMTREFEEKNAGIKVNLTFVAYEELAPKIQTAAKSGGYDVVLGDCIWPSQFAKAGLVKDVSDRVKGLDLDDIFTGALDSTKYDGKFYGLPWLNDVKYLYYNKDMLKQAGIENPPATLDELADDCKVIKEKGIVQYPFAASWSQAEALICDYTAIAGSMGGAFVDATNKPTLNTEANKKAVDWMVSSLKDGITNPKSLEMLEDDVLSTFVSGNAAFAFNWTYMFNEAQDASKSKVAGKVGITTIPGEGSVKSATVNGGMPLMITAGCKNPDAAWNYMVYLSSKSVQKTYCKDALPIWKSLYSDPDVIKNGGEELVNASKTQYSYIVNRPQVPYYNELSTDMQSMLQRVLIGKDTSANVLKLLQEKAESLQNQ